MEQGGLDTLAALCGGASKAQTEEAKTNTTTTANNTTAKASSPTAAVPKPATPSTVQRSAAPIVQPISAPIHQQQQQQQPPSTMDSSVQQWQAIAQAAYGGGVSNPSAASAAVASILQAATQNPGAFSQPSTDPNTVNAMQQVAYYQYLAAAQAQAQAQVQAHFAAGQQHAGNGSTGPTVTVQNGQPNFSIDPNAAAAFAFGGHPGAAHFQMASDAAKRMNTPPQAQQVPQQQQQPVQQQHQLSHSNMQVIPGPATNPAPKPVSTSAPSSMQPPPPPSQNPPVPSALSTNAFASAAPQRPIAPTSAKIMPMNIPAIPTAIAQRPSVDTMSCSSSVMSSVSSNTSSSGGGNGDKKQQKRAANRRSAQLSRKRKKLFIEELKEENDELRRKEQILRSIPDLIVVFDSAGKLWFVSHSVNRFLDFLPEELEGSSFWDRLCEESVRLLKAAFMDALAARQHDMDTAPLGSGVWELRLVDKDGSHKVITLNGVVHFSGDAPECVCSIRPRDDKSSPSGASLAPSLSLAAQASISMLTAIKPQQSVIASSSVSSGSNSSQHNQADDASVRLARGKVQVNPPAVGSNGRRAAQISDGDSGSVVSESGSEELHS